MLTFAINSFPHRLLVLELLHTRRLECKRFLASTSDDISPDSRAVVKRDLQLVNELLAEVEKT